MASRIIVGPVTRAKMGPGVFYTVNTPVGNGSDNKRIADVQLVQLFLQHFYKKEPALFKKLPKIKGAQEILLDGKVGVQTIAAISEFQRDVMRSE